MTNNLFLVFPSAEHEKLWHNFNSEFIARGEKIIPQAARSSDGTYKTFLSTVEHYHLGIDLPSAFVPSSTYFMLNADHSKILGVTSIRHDLTSYLLKIGGHIGYGIVPSERRKGYAAKMLSLSLDKCHEMGLERVLVTCDKDNIGSAKTILKNGGVLENEYAEDTGNLIQRYWISIK